LLRRSKLPIAAPSANLSGLPSPTTVEDVIEDLYNRVPLIIDGGNCKIGLESTVLDITLDPPQILRPGGVTLENLKQILGDVVFYEQNEATIEATPRAPGMKYRHYAPQGSVKIINGAKKDIYALMKEICDNLHLKNQKVGIIISEDKSNIPADYISVYGKDTEKKLSYLASILFHEFREMDRRKINSILVEAVETEGLGAAIMDRLRKSAENQVISL
jgi:L-threonylcarbamoyladenylate synthase